MTPVRRPILAIGLTLVGLTGAAVWSIQRETASKTKASSATAHTPKKLHGWRGPSHGTGVDVTSAAPAPDSSPDGSEAPLPLPQIQRRHTPAGGAPLTDSEVWAHYQPSPEELAYRAYKVEQQADKELRNLVRVLDLSEDQQDRVFAALARSSSYYHPSLQAVGAGGSPVSLPATQPDGPSLNGPSDEPSASAGPATSPDASASQPEVVAELDADQADVYERYTSEREAFWVGVVEDIESELSESP